MSADNWTICPKCVKRSKDFKEAFVNKYYGELDSFVYSKILVEIDKAVEYVESYSSDEYKPNKEILELMDEKDIYVELEDEKYDCYEILQDGSISCSLREDYEQGVDDEGDIFFIYSCSCDCGFDNEIRFDSKIHKIVEKKVLDTKKISTWGFRWE